jgi:polysaccharide export outer membrane protein
MTGTAVVGPDGTVVLGPYGAYRVAGMTLEEARARIEHLLTAHLPGAKVRLFVPELTSAAWRAAPPSPPAAQGWGVARAQAPQQGEGPANDWRAAATGIQTASMTVPGPALPAPDAPAALPVAPKRSTTGQFATVPGLRPVGSPVVHKVQRAPVQAASVGAGEKVPPPRTLQAPPPVMIAHNGPPPEMGHAVHAPAHGGPGHAPNEQRLVSLPPYVIGPPDILQIDSFEGLLTHPVRGPHLVRPDGTVGVGAYGSVYVTGLTVDQARVEIARTIHRRLDPTVKSLKNVIEGLSVDVLAYNSKVYYVITDRTGFGEIVERLPITGKETVLDAISQIKGLPPEASKRRIWVARRTPGHSSDNKLQVDWIGITQRGEMATNYQLLPGDRLYVKAEAIQRADYFLAKLLQPIQRLFGAALLGSETVNSIRFGSTAGVR